MVRRNAVSCSTEAMCAWECHDAASRDHRMCSRDRLPAADLELWAERGGHPAAARDRTGSPATCWLVLARGLYDQAAPVPTLRGFQTRRAAMLDRLALCQQRGLRY